MLTCVKSDLLNSCFITLEVHEGKSLKVWAGTHSFQNLSHKLLTQCTKIPRTWQKIPVSESCLTQKNSFERWELLTWYLIVFSYAYGFSFNLHSLEAHKNSMFFAFKISASPLFLRTFILLCLWHFLYLVSWWCYKAISHLFLVKLLYKLGLDFSHIISQKYSIGFNLYQHKCRCYMFVLLKWAVAVEEIEKEREIITTTAQMAWYCVVPTTTVLTPSFILYWLLALGMTGNLALPKRFPILVKKKKRNIKSILCFAYTTTGLHSIFLSVKKM